ncbi:MAG: Nif3-like dinuclear metal center hexameric protein [Aureispira sp.]
MLIKEVTQYLEEIAPLSYQESYDNAGLLVGNAHWELTGILIALDTIEAVLDEAIAKGCNLIVAHHPIVFGGLKKFTGRNYVERVVIKAIKHDLAIYVAHTNLDNVFKNGVNAKIAQKLGLNQTRILAPKKGLLKKLHTFVPQQHKEKVAKALFEAGAGTLGNYTECSFQFEGTGTFKGGAGATPTVGMVGQQHQEPETKLEVLVPAHQQGAILKALQQAHPYEEVAYDLVALDNVHPQVGAGVVGELEEPMKALDFLKFLKQQMQTDCVRYTALCREQIKRVAVCGGAGSFLLSQAKSAGADIFITADYKYHQFFDADQTLIIADIGHYESEQFTIELFYELLTQKFTNFAIHCTKVTTNPINYL